MRHDEWTCLAVAPDATTAEMWIELLVAAGVEAMPDPATSVSFLGVSPFPSRVFVKSDQLSAAKVVLEQLENGDESRD